MDVFELMVVQTILQSFTPLQKLPLRMEILNSKRFLLSYDSEMNAHVYRGAEQLRGQKDLLKLVNVISLLTCFVNKIL